MRALVLFLLLALTLSSTHAAWGADVLILQSSRTPAYGEALRGFGAACKSSGHTLVLSDYAEVDVLRIVKEERPRLVLAVGDKALAATRKVREVPVLSMLSLSLNLNKRFPDNVGGVAMAVAPGEYIRLFGALGAKRVGVLYDPKKTGLYLKRAAQEARELGFVLVAEPVKEPRDLQSKLEKMKGEVDAFWMLPDSTVVTMVNVEALLLFSMSQNIPAVTFTGQYLKNGAAAALEIDPFDMGVQTGELAASLLKGGTRRVPVVDPRKTRMESNESVLRKLRLKINGQLTHQWTMDN